jgi:N-acyl homoserine lactone hydrolase
MELRLYAMTCGWLTGRRGHLMEGGEGEIELPIPSYLIEHPKGRVLFDTGMHPDCQSDPAGRLGTRLAELFRFNYRAGEEVSARLAAFDRDAVSIDLIVNSHFHFDHVGGNALVPNATMVVQRREWEAGMDPDIAARRGFDRRDFDLGHKLRLVDGEHDLFGDGSVVLLPTYGHTPGHQSMRLRLASDDIVLAGDSCYFCRTLRERRLPRFAHDPHTDARLARPAGNARGRRRAHLLRPPPRILEDRAAGAGVDRLTMAILPRAILFDLDDTILVAFGPAQSQWQRTIAAFTDRLGPIEATVIAAAIQAASTELWADPARHKYWRHRIGAARRRIVASAFATLASAGHPVPCEAVGDALADAYNALHNEELSMFPDAHATLLRLKELGVKLALITNGAAEPQRAKVVRFALEDVLDPGAADQAV